MSYQDDQFNIPSFNKKKTALVVIGVVVIIAFILLSRSMFVTIKSGEAGVIFRPFSGGLDKEMVYGQGFEWIAPWNDMIIYNIQKQEKEEAMDVLSSNGLEIRIDVSIRFFLEKDKIGDLHNKIGTEYIHKIVLPEMRSATRKVIGSYKPEELYSLKRNEIRDKIKVILDKVLSENYIVLDALLIRSVQLPENLKAAIERKLEQEQQSQEYEFRIAKEQKEADRKKIEAQGIQDFQKIVTEGISDKLLKWKGIEATEKIAESPNSKIIIMGNGSDGLPVILGGDK